MLFEETKSKESLRPDPRSLETSINNDTYMCVYIVILLIVSFTIIIIISSSTTDKVDSLYHNYYVSQQT